MVGYTLSLRFDGRQPWKRCFRMLTIELAYGFIVLNITSAAFYGIFESVGESIGLSTSIINALIFLSNAAVVYVVFKYILSNWFKLEAEVTDKVAVMGLTYNFIISLILLFLFVF